jgi:hypothetical protein
VFRETFLCRLEPEAARAFHVFARHFFEIVLESSPRCCHTPLEVTAHDLRAAAVDLRALQEHLEYVGFQVAENETELLTPRDIRWQRFALRMAPQLGRLVDEIEQELAAGLDEEEDGS